MKAKKLVIAAIMIIGLGIFAGCEEQPAAPETSVPITNSMPAQVETANTQATPPPAMNVSTPPIYSEADVAAYDGAIQLKDVSYCDKIKDATYLQTCKTDVTDQQKTSEALAKGDPALCGQLSTNDRQEACKTHLQISADQQKQGTAISDEIAKSNAIVAAGDYARCAAELSQKSIVDNCEMNILFNLALEKNDVSWCDKITDETTKTDCKTHFAALQKNQ